MLGNYSPHYSNILPNPAGLKSPAFLPKSRLQDLKNPKFPSFPTRFSPTLPMALKAVHVSDVPSLDHVPEAPSLAISSSFSPKGVEVSRTALKGGQMVVIGHRGKGMNALSSMDQRLKELKENSILSFNEAGRFPIDFVEFDVQVTKDGCPIIFHDNFILTKEESGISEKRVVDLNLEEFLCYGPQKEPGKVGKLLLRKTKDGRTLNWNVEIDAPSCTLQEAFEKVVPHLGFNIELKFDDNVVYTEGELINVLQAILKVVFSFANDRPIIFSSFQPDAAQLMRKLQNVYPVFFLTNGGVEIYSDTRRNSLDEALKLCLMGGLQGIVSEVKALFRNPTAISRIKESNLSLLTYGQLNNVPESVYMQHLMGIDGVIVDLVQEVTQAVSEFISSDIQGDLSSSLDVQEEAASRPKFTERELSFLLRLIPELVQH